MGACQGDFVNLACRARPCIVARQSKPRRAAEDRTQQDHLAIMAEVETLKAMQAEQHQILAMLKERLAPHLTTKEATT